MSTDSFIFLSLGWFILSFFIVDKYFFKKNRKLWVFPVFSSSILSFLTYLFFYLLYFDCQSGKCGDASILFFGMPLVNMFLVFHLFIQMLIAYLIYNKKETSVLKKSLWWWLVVLVAGNVLFTILSILLKPFYYYVINLF